MLALYPSNKLEHLSFLLGALLKQQPGQVLTPTTILVESPGMQHWLNMELARQQGVAMNLAFPLPVRFMWDTARAVLGPDTVPRQSPYRREVLSWRIDTLLADEALMAKTEMAPVIEYWQGPASEVERSAQRLQLATVMADVFEQYLLYRPDWLFAWEAGEQVQADNNMEAWQAGLWRALVAEAPLHPARLHQQALAALEEGKSPAALPSSIIVFAINTMAPQLVAFIDALARHTDIHIFHLNPSVNYWGDSKSDREQARAIRESGIQAWMTDDQSNPFLGNLGKQGRDLFNLLTQLDSFEVSAFDTPVPGESPGQPGLLSAIQQDILQAARPAHTTEPPADDDSVMVVSAHSALREVQALHDQILAWMQDDPTLTPSDIVVMCPAIEEYAPLIDAVFHRVGTPRPEAHSPPRLPCSIADRSPLDADPMVAAFISLLTLPDSRFRVAEIMDLLRLDAMQARFELNDDDIELMTYWLSQAHVHWGLDGEHKHAISEGATASDTYSWWWGLRRLLLGMVYQDTPIMTRNLLTLPDVEGQQAVTLGKLMQILDVLSEHAKALNTPRSAHEWHDYLLTLRDSCFAPLPEQTVTWESLGKASADLAAHCDEAGYEQTLHLRQVREVLLKRFSSPDAGNHFMTGQITFCSMLPMRSIPFRVVAVLGLNDGEFPRQASPASIDLMSALPRKLGDRSRRLEDRYLFLEAIISARDHLYLSYQGNSAQDNSARQPSLVLAEFLNVLSTGYQCPARRLVKPLPLHPFSAGCFNSEKPGFERGWLKLAQAIQQPLAADANQAAALEDAVLPDQVTPADIARCLAHPLRYYANHQLGVYLDPAAPLLENTEPFAENNLSRYQVIEAMSAVGVTDEAITKIAQRTRMHGDLPDTPLTTTVLTQWQDAAQALTNAIGLRDAEPLPVTWQGQQLSVTTQAWQGASELKWRHAGSQHTQRKCEQLITSLCFSAAGMAKPYEVFYLKWATGNFTVRKAVFQPLDGESAQALLSDIEHVYLRALQQPLAAFADVAMKLFKKAAGEQLADFAVSDVGAQEVRTIVQTSSPFQASLADDPYVQWFYPQGLSADVLPLHELEPLCRAMDNQLKDKKL
ncbi:exodeoxyribonuclease V subunit gamma [Alteromonas sp. ASW11-19]|uniref:RecBCD enzyme subunit RecC n=1 Tax=Alteromonas salexigens TaxID=2982530 RepID=A0ABT2VR82_9ALTE|nr:exodeoxyribonuclease V subunit gamma [Alteromonas salexigens]MCU7555826.1 exodeoxyribonuclease V subunit gamma [Alteromonas salexigens]